MITMLLPRNNATPKIATYIPTDFDTIAALITTTINTTTTTTTTTTISSKKINPISNTKKILMQT